MTNIERLHANLVHPHSSMAAMSLPLELLEELQIGAKFASPVAKTAALKFLHDIDDENLLNDQLLMGDNLADGISLEWPHYSLYFTIRGNLDCCVCTANSGYDGLILDSAAQFIIAHLRSCVSKDDPNDEYKKSDR